jgi:hypothetical protein
LKDLFRGYDVTQGHEAQLSQIEAVKESRGRQQKNRGHWYGVSRSTSRRLPEAERRLLAMLLF